jgi:tryptophanyl-tRNA synthetase
MSENQESTRAYAPRILSGIQPSGELTLGNYFGAIRNWVELQDSDSECFYCVVDYHAITVEHDPEELKRRTLGMAQDLLACGVDPERSTLFIQSQVPEHAELAWILSAAAAYGDLTRMTQFKEKGEKQVFVSVGLFTYPVLQAADILSYQATGVPVGEDQIQHLEFARGIARRFNQRFGEMFPETEPLVTKGSKIMSPADPTRKMSKSLGPKHYIGVFEEEKSFRKKLKSHVTDTGGAPREGETSPGVANLLTLLSAVAPEEVTRGFQEQDKAGTLRYGELKPAVADHLLEHLGPIRERREALKEADALDILREGTRRAQAVARDVLDEARDRIGIVGL